MKYDINSDGQLSKDEIRKAFEDLGYLDELDLDEIIDGIDTNGN